MKGCQECLETIVPALPHAIDLLRDALTDVTATHHAMQSQGGSHQSSYLYIQMAMQGSMMVAHSHASNMHVHGPPANTSKASAMSHGSLVRKMCVASKRRKRTCATNNTQGARNGQRQFGNESSKITHGINRVAKTQTVRAPLTNNHTKQKPSLVRYDPVLVFGF